MFREALGYPTRSPEGGRSVILGGFVLVAVAVCLAIATLGSPYGYFAVVGIVPWLLVRGYYVRVIRTTIGRERPVPPRFDDVRRLLVDGATAVGIAIVYLLPSVAILGPLAAVQLLSGDLEAGLSAGLMSERAVSVIVPLIGLFAIVALMVLLGALYVLPVAVARYAHSGRRRDALELRTVVDGAMTEDYAVAWGLSFVLQALLLPVSYLLRVLLVGFFLQFIVSVGVRYCYGQGVGAALGLAPVEPARTETGGDDSEIGDGRELTPAFVRVDTAAWGVSPGDSVEPMSKSEPFDGSDDASTGAVDDSDGDDGFVWEGVGDPEPDDAADGETETEEGWDLPSAVRRVSDERSTDDR